MRLLQCRGSGVPLEIVLEGAELLLVDLLGILPLLERPLLLLLL